MPLHPTTTALRVAARWHRLADSIGDPEELLKAFEAVVGWLSVLEKDIPWMLEAEKIWNEGGFTSWYRIPEEAKEKLLQDHGVPGLKLIKDYGPYRQDFALKVRFSQGFQRAHDLFLSILQKFQLGPQLRKSIEAAAKYHSASRRKQPSDEQALGQYIKTLATVRGQAAAARQAIQEGVPHGQEGTQEVLRAGSFRVVNTGGFDDQTMQEVVAVVETAEKLLRAKGLDRVCYGDVLVSRTLSKPTTLAFYLVSKDEMFVRANLRGKQHDAVKTVCHELGHRLHFKFLRSRDQELRDMYRQIHGKTNKSVRVREILEANPIVPGDTIVGTKNTLYEVTGTGYGSGEVQVKLQQKSDPTQKAHVGLESYLQIKGLLQHSDLSSHVTPYAAKNYEENFAEMVAFWCLNKLPEDQVGMLEQLVG